MKNVLPGYCFGAYENNGQNAEEPILEQNQKPQLARVRVSEQASSLSSCFACRATSKAPKHIKPTNTPAPCRRDEDIGVGKEGGMKSETALEVLSLKMNDEELCSSAKLRFAKVIYFENGFTYGTRSQPVRILVLLPRLIRR